MKIAIIGAGTWGIVVASYLSKRNNQVTVYHRNSKISNQLESTNKHPNLSSNNISSTLMAVDRAILLANSTILAEGRPSDLLSNKIAKMTYFGKDFKI